MSQIEEWQVPLWDEINRMIVGRMVKPSELRIQSVNRIHEIIRDSLRAANERIAELERDNDRIRYDSMEINERCSFWTNRVDELQRQLTAAQEQARWATKHLGLVWAALTGGNPEQTIAPEDVLERATAAQEELRAAREDTERLDWMESKLPINGEYIGMDREGAYWVDANSGDTLREAIDAARDSEKP